MPSAPSLLLWSLAIILMMALTQHSSNADEEGLRLVALDNGTSRSFPALRGTPNAVLVWKASCAPCVRELEHLQEIAARVPNWHFVTLALDHPDDAAAALPHSARAVAEAWIAKGEPSAVLATLSPDQPALPLTVAVDTRGKICAHRVGILGSDVLKAWSARCSG